MSSSIDVNVDAEVAAALQRVAKYLGVSEAEAVRSLIRKESAADALKTSLQARLLEIVQRPLGARTLLELERTARLARELLAVGADPRAVMPQSAYFNGMTSIGGMQVGVGGSDDAYSNVGVMPVPAPASENFGAQIVRELAGVLGGLGGLGKKQESATELICAISLARAKGLDDVADKLEAQLLGEPATKREALEGLTEAAQTKKEMDRYLAEVKEDPVALPISAEGVETQQKFDSLSKEEKREADWDGHDRGHGGLE